MRACRHKPPAITKSQVVIISPKQAKEGKFVLLPAPVLVDFTPVDGRARVASARSGYAEEIALADFHAIMPENTVGGRSVEIEIRERKAVEEFLPLERQGFVGTDREGDLAAVGALELRGRKFLDGFAGLLQPLPQLFKCLLGVRR